VPEDAKPGLYQGTVSVWDDGFEQAIEIPVSLRVLKFKLQKDSAKHYSAYYYVRNRTQYGGKPNPVRHEVCFWADALGNSVIVS
jgi:hypothetical protein